MADSFKVDSTSSLVYDDRSANSNYFAGRRLDLMALVPAEATRILDVGCGSGRLGEGLKAQRLRYVAGVELHQESATMAASVLDHVVHGSVTEVKLDEIGPPASFDCIIFGDILEHLLDPWETLRRYRALLAPAGVVVASIPNIGHISVIMNLIRGRWEYGERGLLDSTHLRFFTRRSIIELFQQADLEIVRWEGNYRLGEVHRRHQRFATRFAKGPLRALLTYQYLVVAHIPQSIRKSQSETSATTFIST